MRMFHTVIETTDGRQFYRPYAPPEEALVAFLETEASLPPCFQRYTPDDILCARQYRCKGRDCKWGHCIP